MDNKPNKKITLSSKGISKTVFKAYNNLNNNKSTTGGNGSPPDQSADNLKLLKLITDKTNRYVYALGETKVLLFRYKYISPESTSGEDFVSSNDNININDNNLNKGHQKNKTPPFVFVVEKQISISLKNKQKLSLDDKVFCWLHKASLILAADRETGRLHVYSYKLDNAMDDVV